MRVRSGMILALAAGLALGGCAAAPAGGGGPLTSPIGREYEPGTPPSQTRMSQQATIALAQGNFENALSLAQEGIAEDPTNPIHFYLAGEAAAGLGQYEVADSLWIEAERIYPAYEIEIEPGREAAWAEAFNAGVEAYNEGNMQAAADAWRGAHLIYKLRPEAAQNLGIVLMSEGEYEDAIDAFQEGIANLELQPATREIGEEEQAERDEARTFMQQNLAQLLLATDRYDEAEALFRAQLELDPTNIELQANLATALSQLGRAEEAAEIYTRLLSEPNLGADELFTIGVALFNAQDFRQAAEAFGRVTQIQPNSRDAWFNQANALYAAEQWEGLIEIADRVMQLDPLSDNTALVVARAYRELERNQDALRVLEALDAAPVFIEDLQMRPSGRDTEIIGRIVGNRAEAGANIQLRFTFYGEGGNELGTETVTVTAPAPEMRDVFSVSFDQPATHYRYERLP